jgi:hypothetical protein
MRKSGWVVGVMWFALVACSETVPTGTASQGAHAVRRALQCVCNCLGHDAKGDPVWLLEDPDVDDIWGWTQSPGPDGTCAGGAMGVCSGYARDGTFNPNGSLGPCTDDVPPLPAEDPGEDETHGSDVISS